MAQDFLSQEEVDALLKGVTGEADEQPEAPEEAGGVRTYNLATQERIVRGRMPTLNLVQAKPLRGTGLFVLDPNLVFLVVDNLFGGDGRFHTRVEGRDFTPTEQRIIQGLLAVIFAEYEKAWRPVFQLTFEYMRSEMNTQFANIATPSEIVVTFTVNLEFNGAAAAMYICLPYTMIEPIRETLSSAMQSDHVTSDKRWINLLATQVQGAEVELAANLGSASITLRQILAMTVGDVVPVTIDDFALALVGDTPVMECRYGVQNGQYALRVERFVAQTDTTSGVTAH
ncbi:MAG: fliM [Proteobacteria bacterium]|nr:fliM [Pseudomonadota bacterium]